MPYTGSGSPRDISFQGWKRILKNVIKEIGKDNVSIVSAGVAFYAFLAIFPAIAALVSIYGLAMDPQNLQDQLAGLAEIMPKEAFGILRDQLEKLGRVSGSALGWGMAFGILISIWSANKGTKSLFTGVGIAYDTPERRGFVPLNSLSLLFTLGAIILLILCLGLIIIFPAVVDFLPIPEQIKTVISWGRWLLIGAVLIWFLASVYRYGPDRNTPDFRWVFAGAFLATLLWLLTSWGFSFYVKNFGSYGEVYGSISAVVVLLMWLFITCFTVLLGAELNSEIEKYTWKNANG